MNDYVLGNSYWPKTHEYWPDLYEYWSTIGFLAVYTPSCYTGYIVPEEVRTKYVDEECRTFIVPEEIREYE